MTTKTITLVRPVDVETLPPELRKKLQNVRSAKTTRTDYTMEDLILAFIKQYGKATSDDLLIYLYQIRGSITSRGYLHQLIHRLRNKSLLLPRHADLPGDTIYRLTEQGQALAPAYLEPDE